MITDGLFSTTRNPNYLGELMLYGSFATLTDHWLSYAVIAWAFCTIFPARMFQKEISLMQKPGWQEYKERSNVLLPKIFGLGDVSLAVIACTMIVAYNLI